MRRSTKIQIALLNGILLVFSILTLIFMQPGQERIPLNVFVAGSLAEPFGDMPDGNDLEHLFESIHPNIDVRISSGGSAEMIRRITDLGQPCDVLASADFSLIPSMMINVTEKTADFVIGFARNSLVLAFTAKSMYAGELNSSNWYDILRRPDVKFGFSNPNNDPCGYRTMMLLLLAERYYDDRAIFDDLVMANTNIRNVTVSDGVMTVAIPSELVVTDTSKLMMRSAEVELTSALESGSIDYLFIYRSVAIRHSSSGMRYLELPRQINFNDTSFWEDYETVRVIQFCDNPDPSKVRIVIGAPIIYGVTIPKNAEHETLAVEFIRLLITAQGQGVLRSAGLEPINPSYAGYWKTYVPGGLSELVR